MTSDLQLLSAIRAGDQRVFTEFHDNLKPYLLSIARGRLRSAEDAEEMVERAFAQFWRAAANFRGDCAVKTFLTKIVLNLSLNRYHYNRRRFKDATFSLDCPLSDETDATMQDAIPDANANTASHVEHAELEHEIHAAMERLDPKKAEILYFVAIADRSYEEAAETFGIKIGTVKSRVARARQELRTLLAA